MIRKTSNFKSYYKSSNGLQRLRDNETGLWLHLDGKSATASEMWSWCGTQRQASTLRQRAVIRDEPWPYERAPMEEITTDQTELGTHP